MTVRVSGKRGLLPFRRNSILLSFADYVVPSKLPALPAGGFGHVSNTPPPIPGGWQWYNNNTAGCCVVAGGEHEHMLLAMATGRTIPTFRNTTLANYSKMLVAQGGSPYNPDDPSTDTGLDLQAAAKYRQDVGLVDDNGNIHKIDGYALITDVDELEIATYCFGVAGLQLNLPKSADGQFQDGEIWDDLRGIASDGHYPPCFGVNSVGNLILSTWDNVQGATKAYVDRYWGAGVAYLSREYLTSSGKSPEMIDWASLQDDLEAVAQA